MPEKLKIEYVIHIRNLKQALLNHGLVLKKVHRVIKFNQNAWLKPNVDMNTDFFLKQNNFEKDILSWWKMQFLEKLWIMWENIEI